MSDEPVGFLGRWSRRKRGLAEPETEAGQPVATPAEAPAPAPKRETPSMKAFFSAG